MQDYNSKTLLLSIFDISIVKGVAILAMLFHHTYAWIPNDVEPYNGFLGYIGILGKVCVALFLFCSGYGLSTKYSLLTNKNKWSDTFRFILKRLIKFYMGYWMVFFIFVPISIFIFHRSLAFAYYGDGNIIKCLILDILGLQGYHSYNPVWWFNRIIIFLYILFPLIYYVCKIFPIAALVMGGLTSAFCNEIPYNISDIYLWQFPFMVAILYQQNAAHISKIPSWLLHHKNVFVFLTIIAILITVHYRPCIGLQLDALLTLEFVLFTISFLRRLPYVGTILSFLGKYSANIYLIHAFFIYYWFPHWFHTGNIMRCGGNILTLLLSCLVVSVLLEKIKERIGINDLLKHKIIDRI